jgi:hypothetical protein
VSTLSVAELRAVVNTGLDDTRLGTIIDREELEISRRLGAASDGTTTSVVETKPGGWANVYTRRPIVSVTQVREQQFLGGSFAVLAATQYYVWTDEGRIERLPAITGGALAWSSGGAWGPLIEVTYVPSDDRERRKLAIIEFVRIALERTAMKSESVAGEYSYTAPEWDALRATLYRSLGFWEV